MSDIWIESARAAVCACWDPFKAGLPVGVDFIGRPFDEAMATSNRFGFRGRNEIPAGHPRTLGLCPWNRSRRAQMCARRARGRARGSVEPELTAGNRNQPPVPDRKFQNYRPRAPVCLFC
jgi:hypothetical protein